MVTYKIELVRKHQQKQIQQLALGTPPPRNSHEVEAENSQVEKKQLLQGGPVTSYKQGYNCTYRGYNPRYPFIRSFIGIITPFLTNK